jgi:hypothetical protein
MLKRNQLFGGSIAQITAKGDFDHVERERLAPSPRAIRRELNEAKLGTELEEAGKAVRHSQSLYCAGGESRSWIMPVRCGAGVAL